MSARELHTGWETIKAVDIAPADLRSEWAAARERFAGHPLAVTDFGSDGHVYDEIFGRHFYGEEASPAEIIERAATISAQDALAALRHDENDYAHERARFEQEERERPTTAPQHVDHDDWYLPDNCTLLDLPITHSEHAVAYVSFYGAEGKGGHERLIAILRSWRERFGAELVANWGTMLQFAVARPPQTLDEAFVLAIEHDLVAPCTLALPGETVRDHARFLWRRPTWFLHERP
jgi:hypothetical protein